MEIENKSISAKPIFASAKHDPGCRDIFSDPKKDMDAQRTRKMRITNMKPNFQDVVATDDKIGDHKRNYVLIVEDMQIGYDVCIKHTIPPVKRLINTFRQLELPVVWTNWNRYPEDGMYGAPDRFNGAQGIEDRLNNVYIYGKDANCTTPELAPSNDEEMSRTIVSLHGSKFADCDEHGREILFPMLEAWGVNTIVLCGAWTDFCIITTIFDAIDKYGYDLVLVNDTISSTNIVGPQCLDYLLASPCVDLSSEDMIQHLLQHPQLIEAPKAQLTGDVRHTNTKYRHDPILEENEDLKKKINHMEEEHTKACRENAEQAERIKDLQAEMKLIQ